MGTHEETTSRIADSKNLSSTSKTIIGIDLGMTSIVAAHVKGPKAPPVIIPTERGLTALASVVSFANPHKPQVGRAARDQITISPVPSTNDFHRHSWQ